MAEQKIKSSSSTRDDEENKVSQLFVWENHDDVQFMRPSFLHRKILKVSIGQRHCAFLTTDNQVYCSGSNSHGQLGIGHFDDVPYLEPVLVETLKDACIIDISCGLSHTAAVSKRHGGVYCWGDSENGQCALGKPDKVNIPSLIHMPVSSDSETSCIHGHVRYPPFVQVSCGDTHTLAVNVVGEIWTWGSGSQLGLTKIKQTHVAKKIEYLSGYRVLSVAAGAEHSLALVRKNSPAKRKRKNSVKKTVCPKCNSDIYTFVDINDVCIISDEHKCPLGCDIDESSLSGGTLSRDISPDCTKDDIFTNNSELSKSDSCKNDQENSSDEPKTSSLKPAAESSQTIRVDETADPVQLRSHKVRQKSFKSFANESEARNFLERQLSMKIETKPDEFQPVGTMSSAIKQTVDTLWTSVTQPSTIVTNVSSATAKVVSNIRTSMDRYGISLGMADLETISKSSGSLESLGQESHSTSDSQINGSDIEEESDDETEKTGQAIVDPFANIPKLTETTAHSYDNSPVNSQRTGTLQTDSDRTNNETLSPVARKYELPADNALQQSDTNKKTLPDTSPSVSPTRVLKADIAETSFTASMDVSKVLEATEPVVETRQRKVSIKTAMEFKQILAERSPEESDVDLGVFNTEVWSWGKGQYGQLGHGDQLDRPQPCSIKMLGNQHITKIAAGAKHSLALSATSKSFSWGHNKEGQLCHKDTMSVSPWKVNFLKKSLVWDIHAGRLDSLYSCYSSSYQPDVYITGSKKSLESSTPHKISQLRQLGWIKQVVSGENISACILDTCPNGVVSVLHELVATERNFYNQLEKILFSVIKPLMNIDVYATIEKSSDGPVLAKLFENYEKVVNMVGLNVIELTRCIQGAQDIDKMSLVAEHQGVMFIFKEYSEVFGDCLAMGAFEILGRSASSFLEKLEDVFQDLLEEGKFDKANLGISFRRLMQIPLRRLGHYNRLLGKLSSKFSENSNVSNMVKKAGLLWDALKDSAKSEHTTAEKTKIFWDYLPSKYKDSLRCAGRRLLRESKNSPLTLHNAGRFAVHFFILFNDVFVHAQYSTHQMFPLTTVWAEPLPEGDSHKNGICVRAPEERLILLAPSATEKADWLRAINSAVLTVIHRQKGVAINVSDNNPIPPLNRTASHTFRKSGPHKNATYTGNWQLGKPHGSGELNFADGRKYTGRLKHGLEHGYGVLVSPRKEELEVYEGNWRDGKMHGYGKIRYWDRSRYEGYFKEGQRCGHGIYRQGNLTGNDFAAIYIGEWSGDKFNGYGVHDNIQKGEKYMGMWVDGNKNGPGVVVTLDGMYYEGNFVQNKLTGYGIMLTEDNTCYEGEFQAGTQLIGKGTLKFTNGVVMDGYFTGTWPDGVKFNGSVKKSEKSNEPRRFSHIFENFPKNFGKIAVAPGNKWSHIIQHCQAMLCCQPGGGKAETDKAWEVVAVMLAAGRKAFREDKERLSSVIMRRKSRSNSLSISDDLEKIPPHDLGVLTTEYHEQIVNYLNRAFRSPFHPLGKLMTSLVDVFRATYVGIGAHPRLLYHAVLEIKSYIVRMYQVVRILFPDLPKDDIPVQIYPEDHQHVETPEECLRPIYDDEETGCMVISATGMLYKFLLPEVYPSLFTLYALYNEKEDERYWERVQRLNKQSDVALLSYLGVEQTFWCIDDSMFQSKAQLTVKDQVYKGAVEFLQQLSTGFSPSQKLDTIRNTFTALNECAKKTISEDFLWGMDELFPVFQYVVVRSRIPNLGAEIHFIDDLMESHLELGELGIMFTTLKASYFQIQNEKILM